MDWKEIAVLSVLAVVVFILYAVGRKKEPGGRGAKLMKKYTVLTPEMLAAVPEEEVVEAVVSHVLACAEGNRRPDPVMVLAAKPYGFTVVYSVWAVCKEMAAGDYRMLKHTATRELIEPAGAAFGAIDAPLTAAAWQALTAAQAEAEPEAEAAFHRAVEQECPLTLCVAYIRENPEQFGAKPEEAV